MLLLMQQSKAINCMIIAFARVELCFVWYHTTRHDPLGLCMLGRCASLFSSASAYLESLNSFSSVSSIRVRELYFLVS